MAWPKLFSLTFIALLSVCLLALFQSGAHTSGISFTEHSIASNFDGAVSVYVADLDGDTDLDIVAAGSVEDSVHWWENTAGNGSAWSQHTIDDDVDGAISVMAVDLDNDGDQDLVGAAYFDQDVIWWENSSSGTVWTKHIVDGGVEGANSVYAADVDGDNDLDILAAGAIADDIIWWENTDGNGSTWNEHLVAGSFDGASSVYASDMDRDGDIDIIGSAYGAGTITWWENTAGNGSMFTEHHITQNFAGASSVITTDLDRDGYQDVIATAYEADTVTWWENSNGNGSSWSQNNLSTTVDGASLVTTADLNSDGEADIIAAAVLGDQIMWWEQPAGGINGNWTAHTLATSLDGAAAISGHDIDADGDIDVASAAILANQVAWWENPVNITAPVLPTATLIPTATATPTITPTPEEPTATATPTMTSSATATAIVSASATATVSATATPSPNQKLFLPLVIR